jgi:hypothetical protein
VFWERRRHYWPFVLTAFGTGMRPSELCGLRWGDVDLRAGQLDVKRSRTMHEDHATKTHGSSARCGCRPPSSRHCAGSFRCTSSRRLRIPERAERPDPRGELHEARVVGGDPRDGGAGEEVLCGAATPARQCCSPRGVPAKLVAEQLGPRFAMLQLHYGRYMATASDTLDAALGLDSETVPERSQIGTGSGDRAKVSR